MLQWHLTFNFSLFLAESIQQVLFDLVFLVCLRYVMENQSLVEIIKKQHELPKENSNEFIESILEGRTKHRVLLMLDGYDEYKPGTNRDIDRAIESTIGNCFLILKSRPGIYLKECTRDKMDGEIIIEGLSEENIKKVCFKYLKSDTKCTDMFGTSSKSWNWWPSSCNNHPCHDCGGLQGKAFSTQFKDRSLRNHLQTGNGQNYAENLWLQIKWHSKPWGAAVHAGGILLESSAKRCSTITVKKGETTKFSNDMSAGTWIKKTRLPADLYTVSRCRTRGESREFIVRKQQSTRARDLPWLWNQGETLPEVQNRGISGPTKRTYVLQKF